MRNIRMHRIGLQAEGSRVELGTPTVKMVTGTGSVSNGKICLTSDCCSDQEIDWEADLLIEQVEDWRVKAKKELKKRKAPRTKD